MKPARWCGANRIISRTTPPGCTTGNFRSAAPPAAARWNRRAASGDAAPSVPASSGTTMASGTCAPSRKPPQRPLGGTLEPSLPATVKIAPDLPGRIFSPWRSVAPRRLQRLERRRSSRRASGPRNQGGWKAASAGWGSTRRDEIPPGSHAEKMRPTCPPKWEIHQRPGPGFQTVVSGLCAGS